MTPRGALGFPQPVASLKAPLASRPIPNEEMKLGFSGFVGFEIDAEFSGAAPAEPQWIARRYTSRKKRVAGGRSRHDDGRVQKGTAMHFEIRGLDPAPFHALYGLSEEALAIKGARRVIADRSPGYPCRITLEDAIQGESLILINHVSHDAPTPYRSAFAIFVREGAEAPACYRDELPPVMRKRPIALRQYSEAGDLVGASLCLDAESAETEIKKALAKPQVALLHAHNAMHGCFAAAIYRA
jgi:hypothetical protein